MREPDVNEALLIAEMALTTATQAIESKYIRLPIDGGPPAYRERLYCYELYHQLRCSLGDQFPYSVGGEVDKTGHPRMIGNRVTGTKPDLLIHRPGHMPGNLVVVEIKPAVTRRRNGIRKDLQTLTAYKGHGYRRAWYLIYGGDETHADRFRAACRDFARNDNTIELQEIELLWHPGEGRPAMRLDWGVA